MNVIETHQLTHRYARTEALHALDLTIPVGSVCALLGPNGAGKTTTIKLLMNLLRPTGGSARVLGVDSRELGPREFAQIGYVSENQELPLWMTVRQLIDYTRAFYPTWDKSLETTLQTQFALPGDRKLKQLSRGMQMKAHLLIALAFRPKLLVLDEPFSGLDPLVRDEFVRGLLEVSDAGEWTVLVSSHDIEEVERLADRVALIDGGRLRLHEPIDTLQARFRRVEVTLHADNAPVTGVRSGWLEFEQSGRRIRFVDSSFRPDETERQCRERFPDSSVTAQPMSLRDIFIALSRGARSEKGAAA